jgi:AmiR/NasT family two-component response regulator
MRLDGGSVGATKLCRMGIHHWQDDEIEAVSILANVATSYVVLATELERSRASVAQLEKALESRVVIEQGKDVIAAERDVCVDDAFEILRSHARNHRANLPDVSEAVVRLGLRT